MAAQKFFHGLKVKTFVDILKPKRDGDEKTLTITFRIGLNGNTVRSAPKFVQTAYKAVNEDACDLYGITKEFDKINTECFTLEEHKKPEIHLAALHFEKLAVLKTKNSEGDESIVLKFQSELSWNSALWSWIGDHYASDIWVKFDSAQATLLDLEESEDEDGISEEEQGTLAAAN
jgi:hypothetical protein